MGMDRLPERAHTTVGEDDLRHQYRLMLRWSRWFGKSDLDWVMLAAERYRDRHPLPASAELRLAA